jgi:predicted dinucleotide-binding enzyme
VQDAARFGELVLVAVPLKVYGELPVEAFDGDVVADAMNYYPQRDGQLAELDRGEATSSELLQRHLPGAKVVKAFNTIYFRDLAENGDREGGDERQAIFIAGVDEDATAAVARLVEEIGFAPVQTGSLAESAIQQPGAPVYAERMTVAQAREALERIP